MRLDIWREIAASVDLRTGSRPSPISPITAKTTPPKAFRPRFRPVHITSPRRAYHHSKGFDVLFRTVSVMGIIGSVPHQAAARIRSVADLSWRRPFHDRHRRRFEPVHGARWLAETRSTSPTIICNRTQLVNKTRDKRFVKMTRLA